jgi:hypothetical protein
MRSKLPFLPDDHHYAIANVAARSAQLDHYIELTIQCALRDHEQTARFALKNLGQDRVVGLMEAVLLDVEPKAEAGIKSVIAEINRLRTARNEILHWLWGKTEDPDIARHATLRPFREPRHANKTAAEVQAVADDLMKVIHTIGDWQRNLLAYRSLSASPDKPWTQARPPD